MHVIRWAIILPVQRHDVVQSPVSESGPDGLRHIPRDPTVLLLQLGKDEFEDSICLQKSCSSFAETFYSHLQGFQAAC